MLKFRVIPSLLVKGHTLYKGQKFDNWRVVGNPVAAAKLQGARDADELLLLDVRATTENRTVDTSLIEEISTFLRIPLCVGGGINSEKKIEEALSAGADKVLIGSACGIDIGFVKRAADMFGSQAIVCSVDAIGNEPQKVAISSGTQILDLSPLSLATSLADFGAGEILLQCVDRDGTGMGLDSELISIVSQNISIPVIASSGMGEPSHALSAAQAGASAVASGAMLQFTQFTPADIKLTLSDSGVPVRN